MSSPLYGSIYVKEIDWIAAHIRRTANPKSVEDLKKQKISECRVTGGKGGYLRVKERSDTVYMLDVGAEQNSYDILVTMIHELFHIPFLYSKILPRAQWGLDEAHRKYLEDTIDSLAEEFVLKYEDWTIKSFKEWFGRDHTEFPRFPQPQAVA